jgi:hypothetical protein
MTCHHDHISAKGYYISCDDCGATVVAWQDLAGMFTDIEPQRYYLPHRLMLLREKSNVRQGDTTCLDGGRHCGAAN